MALLHAGAALLTLGVVSSMYLRGLVFDYRAGWDSTFLGAGEVHALLGAVLGPASAVSGIALPDVPALARLRWADGGGEGAARWIHLYALTLAGAIVVPRLLLALWSALRARQAARHLALPLDEPYFVRLQRALQTAPQPVTVLPYSYRLGAPQQAGLAAALTEALGPRVQPQLAEPLPLGAEDKFPQGLPAELADTVVALFALTATPEREVHGVFLRALARLLPARCTLHVVVDESGFRQRFAATADGARRLAQRREAWQQPARRAVVAGAALCRSGCARGGRVMAPTTIALSLVSHTNVGKTTLARTLLGRDIGEVRDDAHVTEAAEAHVLVESTAGDRLMLWDTPGFGDSLRLAKRLALAGNPIGWFLSEVWDRWRDRAFWSSQRALRNVLEQADVVLYLVNAVRGARGCGLPRCRTAGARADRQAGRSCC